MLGMPSSVSIADENGFDVRNNYFGTFVQDTWRATRNLTVNLGLRFECENGIKEQQNRAMLWFDPERRRCRLRPRREAAYAANPDPGTAGQPVQRQGGSVYAGAAGL